MANESNKFIKPVLQVALSHLIQETVKDLENNNIHLSGVTYYKKEIGEQSSVGFFIVADPETLKVDLPNDLRLILTLGVLNDVYYVEVDEMFEELDILPVYQ